ncbi:site-specific DNA-methyltransferase [Sphingorhabdus sp. EL138]|uniref:site-specific DNA-methyltransferase n=1 Tax=Sphingorhabdus sp. EL138 TaxID=2073156 RepID=UPI0025F4DDBB|nr:site-specific DNA-methyltransferase [Sphingorhabdus sp. EL138]
MAKKPLSIDTLTHEDATRLNAPTAELEAFVSKEMKRPIQVAYERRNPDLDPQLVWRGKDMADWSDLVVEAPPLYIQEKIHPKAIIEDLKRSAARKAEPEPMADLFADFNGIPPDAKTEFYAHEQHWSNRMILGDGLKVMASLAEREGLKGSVQSIFIDPPYGIKFNSNFQWSTTDTKVHESKADHLTREPEQVKAFRDTWRDGIHSYLTYLRDRLTVARDLLTESGSVFVQIGEENVHRVRALMDEVFGEDNFIGMIWFRKKTMPLGATYLERMGDYIIWFGKNKDRTKFRRLFKKIDIVGDFHWNWREADEVSRRKFSKQELEQNPEGDPFRLVSMWPPSFSAKDVYAVDFRGKRWLPGGGQCYPSGPEKLERLIKANRLEPEGQYLRYVMKLSDDDTTKLNMTWTDTAGARDKRYIVETSEFVVQRCILMTTDPGDLVLDPTCGSGTTAYVAEQWGRRWITIDTSRVAMALARARLMGARYPWYLLADSKDGQLKEGEVTRSVPRDGQTFGRVRQGFVYKRVPHITLKSIANNAEIDTIWEQYQPGLEDLRHKINQALGTTWQEWEIPQVLTDEHRQKISQNEAQDGFYTADDGPENWLSYWWRDRIDRQKEIDASIAAKADSEYLYDQPYTDNARVRVAGPFTVESLSPHRVPAVDFDDSLFDEMEATGGKREKLGDGGESGNFTNMVLDNLKKSGVQQSHKVDRLVFTSLKGWPGQFICAEGMVRQKSADEAADDDTVPQRRAAILIGPEYGTVSRSDLTAAAREAAEAGFDMLIAAAFNFDAHASEMDNMGSLAVLKARMNPDLHMPDLANTGAGNLFTVFGEPDVVVHEEDDGRISIEVQGVDMYKAGEIVSANADDIAVWFLDTDYDYESFFVRHAYFPGANDPYKALRTTLKAEIDEDAWESLKRTRSRPFERPASGRVAVKVVNHLGDEVMKVLEV